MNKTREGVRVAGRGGHARSAAETFTCGGCPSTWTGTSRAHCSACHRTFSGVHLFDAHRRNGRCLHPAYVTDQRGERLMYQRGGLWRGRELSSEDKRRIWG